MGAPQFARQMAGSQGKGVSQSPSGQVETEITAQRSEAVDFVSFTGTGDLAGGADERTIVRAPAGSIYMVVALSFVISGPGGTTGDHRLIVQDEAQGIAVLDGIADKDSQLDYTRSHWRKANLTKLPSSEIAQLLAIRGLWCDENNGIEFKYANRSDATQTEDRVYRLWLREVGVA